MSRPQSILDIFLPQHFGVPAQNLEYSLARTVTEAYEDMQHIILRDANFPLPSYLDSKNVNVKLTNKLRVHAFDTVQDNLVGKIQTGTSEFQWAGTEFIIYKFTWHDMFRGPQALYVVLFPASGEDGPKKETVGEDLITEAYKWSLALKEEMWMFSNGCWSKDKKLWAAIQLSGWDSLVLDPEFVAGLKRDTETFFSSKKIYESLGIPWKRGILLLGPPGNGKTESIKVLLKETGITSLYVKSFTTDNGAEAGIRAIFEFARQRAPCILVLEDLDSMVTPAVRSFFLNEIDGLEKNDGILTIATSNHPERIDDAILNRPSRFDVKYTFDLPTYDLRKAYIDKWIIKAREVNGIDFKNKDFMRNLAQKTDNFSFAFLKELFVSFLLRTAHDKATGKEAGDPESVMQSQVMQLVAQLEMGTKAKHDGTEAGGVVESQVFTRPTRMGNMSAVRFHGPSGTSSW